MALANVSRAVADFICKLMLFVFCYYRKLHQTLLLKGKLSMVMHSYLNSM